MRTTWSIDFIVQIRDGIVLQCSGKMGAGLNGVTLGRYEKDRPLAEHRVLLLLSISYSPPSRQFHAPVNA